MKVVRLLLSLLLVGSPLAAKPWMRVAGGASAEDLYAVVVSPKGIRIAAGYTTSVPDRVAEGWLVAHNAAGQMLWQKTLGLDYIEYANDIAVTSDGGLIMVGRVQATESDRPDLWIVKLSAKYKVEWWQQLGGADWESGACAIQTGDGGYLVAGNTDSAGQGSSDGWLLRFDADGELLWQRTYGGVGWERLRQVIERPDGTLLACGTTQSFGSGGNDMWLLRLKSTGEVLWAKTYGGVFHEECTGMALDADGFIILVGYLGNSESHPADAWILRLRSNGTIVWKKRYGGDAEFDSFMSVVNAPNKHYIVVGNTGSYGNGSLDGWAMELDETGRAVWQRTYGWEGDDYFMRLTAVSKAEYLVCGGTPSLGAGGQEGWLMGFGSSGAPAAGCTELSRTISVAPRASQASARSVSVSTSVSSAAPVSRSMHIEKATLPTSDPCSARPR